MNRQINNTLSALVASGALLVAVLVLASPAPADVPQTGRGSTQITGIDTGAMLADAMDTTSTGDSDVISTSSTSTDSTSTRSTGTSSRWHHGSLAMPYFSFVPRG